MTTPWKLVGGHPSLDFVNTVGGRDVSGGPLADKLKGYSDLLAWSVDAGLTNQGEAGAIRAVLLDEPGESSAAFGRAIELRETLWQVMSGWAGGILPDPAVLAQLNDFIRMARAHQILIPSRNGFSWSWDRHTPVLDRLSWELALSGGELLASPTAALLRRCGGEQCGWLFLDRSRNGTRRWCDMKDCGTRAKVRRFRERQRQTEQNG